jgi:hypothetical protein
MTTGGTQRQSKPRLPPCHDWLLRLSLLKVVQIDALDFDGLRYADADVEPDHQVREGFAVNQHEALDIQPTLRRRPRAAMQ